MDTSYIKTDNDKYIKEQSIIWIKKITSWYLTNKFKYILKCK